MAYAALLSLAQTTGKIILDQDKYPISRNKKQQIRSIYEPFIFLQEFLEDFPQKANILDGRIRDLAYEAEDIIESFMLEEAPSHWWSVLAAKSKFKRQMRKIRDAVDSITREVMIIKNNSADAVKLCASSSAAAGSPSRPAPVINSDYMVGLHEDLVAIKSRLCGESPNLEAIPIVGMGGIGKTTLAKYAYDDPLTVQQFDVRAWVTVSQDYNADAVLSALLASMEEFDKDGSEKSSELAGEKVFKILKRRRYLLVMDDIWSTQAWDDVSIILPDDGNGSRVMLTTRETDVAAYVDRLHPHHKMRLMDEAQSWDLLRQKVFAHRDCPPELEDIGKEIARSCKGLPLAIVVVGGLLSTVNDNPASFGEIAQNVNSVTTEGKLERILSLSYTHLPHYLRACFLYMGMFPEDCEVRVSKLIKLWAAEGFLRRRSRSLEDEAVECLEDLVRRNLVLVTKRKCDGGIKSCGLHDLMRDLCIRKAHDEKFLVDFSSRYITEYLSKKGRKKQHRISVTPSGLPYLSKIYGLSIRTILCFHGISIANMLERFRLLRVLDAGDAYVRSLPNELFDLFHVVYLAIYYLGKIPPSISKLHNLQYLILHSRNEWMNLRSHSVHLPLEIWGMPKLRHLVFYGRLPNPEGRTTSTLENLQTLSVVSQAMCSERILSMIPNLKKLEIDCSDFNPSRGNLVHLRQLEDLKLRSSISNVLCCKEIFTFPRTLKKLTLSRLALPWEDMTVVGSLPNLRVLKLTHWACKGNTWETTEDEFPQLEFLLIEKSYLEHWITESSHFPMLKRLVLDDCWHLAEIPEGVGEIPSLELIELKGKAGMSLVESATRILEEQRDCWGNDALQVRCVTHR